MPLIYEMTGVHRVRQEDSGQMKYAQPVWRLHSTPMWTVRLIGAGALFTKDLGVDIDNKGGEQD